MARARLSNTAWVANCRCQQGFERHRTLNTVQTYKVLCDAKRQYTLLIEPRKRTAPTAQKADPVFRARDDGILRPGPFATAYVSTRATDFSKVIS